MTKQRPTRLAVATALMAVCVLLMALAGSAQAGAPQPPPQRHSGFVVVSCDGTIFNYPAPPSSDGQVIAQNAYNLHHEETCTVNEP